jgi:phosphate transport system substrate-binding protein
MTDRFASLGRRVSRTALPILVAGSMILAACQAQGSPPGTSAGSGNPSVKADLLGAGATFPDPVYQEWIGAFVDGNPGISITYEPIGSGGGVEQFIAQSTDFGGSDAFMSDDEIAAAEKARGCDVLHIPTVFGAVAIAYNLPGIDGLVLDADAIAGIFGGSITRWNDPGISALNAGVSLPATPIIVAHRSDGSGTTSIFTTYLDNEVSAWQTKVGKGKEVSWPTGVGGQGNDGVAAAIAQNPGGIGYVELSYATENDLAVASVKNAAGSAIEPNLDSTAAAADGIDIPDDLRFNILGVDGDGYPIAGATWVLAYACGYDQAKADALKAFLRWSLTDGDEIARQLHYAPIGEALQARALANVDRIDTDG